MDVWSHFALLLRSTLTAEADRDANPWDALDAAEDAGAALLLLVRNRLVDVAASKHQLTGQLRQAREERPRLEARARRALEASHGELARRLLERRLDILEMLTALEAQIAEVASEEERLLIMEQALAARIGRDHRRGDVLRARLAAAEAQVALNSALSGVAGGEDGHGRALEAAAAQVEQMQARAEALANLVGEDPTRLLEDLDELDRGLRQLATAGALESDLEALLGSLTTEER
jgi:phage shock protein A